jgi:hypothetical protein
MGKAGFFLDSNMQKVCLFQQNIAIIYTDEIRISNRTNTIAQSAVYFIGHAVIAVAGLPFIFPVTPSGNFEYQHCQDRFSAGAGRAGANGTPS